MKVYVLISESYDGPVGVVTSEKVADNFLKLQAHNDYITFNLNEPNALLEGLNIPKLEEGANQTISEDDMRKLREITEEVTTLADTIKNKGLKTSFLKPLLRS